LINAVFFGLCLPVFIEQVLESGALAADYLYLFVADF
jgi:hypothetical protein